MPESQVQFKFWCGRRESVKEGLDEKVGGLRVETKEHGEQCQHRGGGDEAVADLVEGGVGAQPFTALAAQDGRRPRFPGST